MNELSAFFIKIGSSRLLGVMMFNEILATNSKHNVFYACLEGRGNDILN